MWNMPLLFSSLRERMVYYSNESGTNQVYISELDNSNPVQLTSSGANTTPFLVQGKIIFASDRDGNSEAYIMNVDGSSQTRLTNNVYSTSRPHLHNDLNTYAYADDRDGGSDFELFQNTIISPSELRLTNITGNQFTAYFGQTDNYIYYTHSLTGENGIRKIPKGGGSIITIFSGTSNKRSPRVNYQNTHISYTSLEYGATEEIKKATTAGASDTRLTTNSARDLTPSWNLAGTHIFYNTNRNTKWQIYRMANDGTSDTEITSNTLFDIQDPHIGLG